MRPTIGDCVKFTDKFINSVSNNPSLYTLLSGLKDLELMVTKVKLATMFPFRIYSVFFLHNNMLNKIDINETGHYVDSGNNTGNHIVFEYFDEEEMEEEAHPVMAKAVSTSFPSSSREPLTSKPATVEEANAVCPVCGAPAIDLIFNTKCTNPSCKNYR